VGKDVSLDEFAWDEREKGRKEDFVLHTYHYPRIRTPTFFEFLLANDPTMKCHHCRLIRNWHDCQFCSSDILPPS
jgi:hypothetical protein